MNLFPLSAVAVLAFVPSLLGVFQFDDYNVIVNSPEVQSWQALADGLGSSVRPVLKASYALNWTLGLGVVGFHLVNIAVHALNAVLVYQIGRRLTPHSGAALAAALLFALHPVQVEAVTYISGRSSSLMASFYLAALLVYLRGGHWALSSLFFVLAAATKETALTLPAALLLCEIVRSTRWKEIVRRQAAHWCLLVAGLAFVLLNERYFDLIAFGFTRRDVADNLLTQVGAISYLAGRLIGLHGASIDPALPVLTQWSGALALQAVLLGALLALGVANLRARPWIAFGVLWFFLQLAPTNSIVPRLDVANDRQLYLASWGLFFAISVQVARLRLPRRLAMASAGGLLVILAGASVLRQLDYRSEIALWEADVRAVPWNARAHNNLGYAYQQAGRLDAARDAYQAALTVDPSHTKARFNLLLLD
ncbi:MAG TPA: tetratricopeptide repeat protein [Burkholderiales bacterium]|nr:tetratricopeptide repeat protein [Burkholderiales bacterium]